MAEKKVTLSRPKDKSLEAFKAWINELATRLTGSADDDGSMSEDDWKKAHEEFWRGK